MKRGYARRALVVPLVVVLLANVPLFSEAADEPEIACVASGVVRVFRHQSPEWGQPYRWFVYGVGSCVGAPGLSYNVYVSGAGFSRTAGVCGGGWVSELYLQVSVYVWTDPEEPPTVIPEVWRGIASQAFGPIVRDFRDTSTYPVATPFLISTEGSPEIGGTGAGVMFSRLRLRCPPAGKDAARFAWAQAAP